MSSFCIDKCCSSDSSSTHWGQLRTKRLEGAVGWAVGAGRMLKGVQGLRKQPEKKSWSKRNSSDH